MQETGRDGIIIVKGTRLTRLSSAARFGANNMWVVLLATLSFAMCSTCLTDNGTASVVQQQLNTASSDSNLTRLGELNPRLSTHRHHRGHRSEHRNDLGRRIHYDNVGTLSRNARTVDAWEMTTRSEMLTACIVSRGEFPCPFQTVFHAGSRSFVFSAYAENREAADRAFLRLTSVVEIDLLRNESVSKNMSCLFPRQDSQAAGLHGSTWVQTTAQVSDWCLRLAEYTGKPFAACFIDCKLPLDFTPSFVSLQGNHVLKDGSIEAFTKSGGNILPIVNNAPEGAGSAQTFKLGACVKTISPGYRKPSYIVQFLEYNLMMGVQHFTIYLNSTDRATNCILDSYVKQGVVEVVDMFLELDESQVGQSAGGVAGYDCSYKRRHTYQHMVYFLDWDEYIVPHNGADNFLEVIETAAQHRNVSGPEVAAYVFQNAFFIIPEDAPHALGADWDNPLPCIVDRHSRVYPHDGVGSRSKCIHVPRHILEPGIHVPEKIVDGKLSVHVDPEIAVIHHYRQLEKGKVLDGWTLQDAISNATKDYTFKRYEPVFLRRFKEAKMQIRDYCGKWL